MPVELTEDNEKDPLLERVFTPSGSVAGAGSDFFHKYRLFRNMERDRMQEMDANHDETVSQRKFQQERMEAIMKNEQHNKGKRDRRKRKKEEEQRMRAALKLEKRMNNINKEAKSEKE